MERGESRAIENHDQTLEELNERGGLCVEEIMAAIQGKSLREIRSTTLEEAVAWLKKELAEFEQADLKKQVRSDTLKEAAALFAGMNWLCLDHGGEEAEEIQKRILSLDKS